MERVIKEHTFLDELFNDEIIVIDLGACRGEFTNDLNKEYKVKRAILVEANPTNFKNLDKKENYTLYNKLVSDKKNETFKFYEDPNSPYNGSNKFNYFNGIEHNIESITLEELIEENNLDYIDILKIDIEGSEYDIMPSISEEILSKIKQITIEFHDFIDNNLKNKTENIIKRMESFGFKKISKPIKYMNNSNNYDVLFYKK
jgi:FkbM family methyltransferase